MLFRSVTPPLPSSEYLTTMLSSLKKHMASLKDAEKEFTRYFKHSIDVQSKIAPNELTEAYKQIETFGCSFINSINEFILRIEPIVKSNSELLEKRSDVSKALEEYQKKILLVRKEPTEENISIEGEKLQNFVTKLNDFNKKSNSLKACLLNMYLAACNQLENDINESQKILNNAINSPLSIGATQEEKEIDDLIRSLNQEIAQKLEEEARIQEETRLKEEQKQKEEKERELEAKQTESPTKAASQNDQINNEKGESNEVKKEEVQHEEVNDNTVETENNNEENKDVNDNEANNDEAHKENAESDITENEKEEVAPTGL